MSSLAVSMWIRPRSADGGWAADGPALRTSFELPPYSASITNGCGRSPIPKAYHLPKNPRSIRAYQPSLLRSSRAGEQWTTRPETWLNVARERYSTSRRFSAGAVSQMSLRVLVDLMYLAFDQTFRVENTNVRA